MTESEQLSKNLIESSDEDFIIMCDLYKMKHYAYTLFFGHLVLEKLFKAAKSIHSIFQQDMIKLKATSIKFVRLIMLMSGQII